MATEEIGKHLGRAIVEQVDGGRVAEMIGIVP